MAGRRVGVFFGFGLLALLLIGGASLVWGALVYANLRTTPSVPWALPALLVFLWALWAYLDGGGPPRRTAGRRAELLRARIVPMRQFVWSAIAGLLAIASLAGIWIVLFRLFPTPVNPLLPENFTSSGVMTAAIIAGASLLAPITEESAVRGYLQSVLEKDWRPVTAVALSSLVFAIAHATQGLVWSKLLFYFLVGVSFGTIAFLTDSVLPAIPVHIAGDLVFFLFVWPQDSGRTLVRDTGVDAWFWIHVAQALLFAALSALAFVRLRNVARGERQSMHRAASKG